MRFIQIICFAALLVSSHVSMAASPAPAINLPALSGNFDLAELQGKVVYLDFWASWCKPCKKSFPWMSEIKKKYVEQGLEVVAINLDSDRSLADKFLKEFDINFVVAFDSEATSADEYKLRGMPTSYLIGRDGNLYASHIGFRGKDTAKLEVAIKRLLDAPGMSEQ